MSKNGNNGNNEPSQSEPQLHQEEAQYSPFHRTETDLGVKPEPKPETKSVISVRSVMKQETEAPEQNSEGSSEQAVDQFVSPLHCPHPETCGYHGVFLHPDEFNEHIKLYHANLVQSNILGQKEEVPES